MENNWYSFDVPIGWTIFAVLAGALLAFLLYSKKGTPWSRNTSLLLGALRMMSIFLIILLLLNPLLKLSINHTDKPIVVVALDNSESISLRSSKSGLSEIKQWIKKTQGELSGRFEFNYKDFSASDLDTISFNSKTTDLGDLLRDVEVTFEGENVGSVVLASDGVINAGPLPQYRSYSFPIYTLGLGDTIAPKDLSIKSVRNNRIAYQGNKFPIRVELQQKGFDNTPVNISIYEGGKLLERQSLELKSALSEVDFNLEATEAGLKHLVIQITRFDDESSFANNKKDIYINVIEGKDKVLIVAPAPHPDIGAIRKVLASAANYETDIYIPGVSEGKIEKEYDVLIEHNAFSGTRYPEVNANGIWYVLGENSIPRMNKELSFFNIQQRGKQKDNIRPQFLDSFSKFKLNAENLKAMEEYAPLAAPYGEYGYSGPVEVLLNQKVGSLDTGKPLMFYYDDGDLKNAITVAGGFWKWRMQEAGFNENAQLFDEIVLKTVQFLSIKEDRKRFVVRPRQSTFNESDRVFIETEVYNEIFERSYNNTIKLNLTDEEGVSNASELVDSEVSSAFNLGRMNQGVYKYTATATVSGKVLTERGEFIVNQTQVESLNLKADHQLLRQLARKTGGKFYSFNDRDKLTDNLSDSGFKNVIRTEEEFFPLINSLWIIGVIVLLLSVEWFFRKYLGAY
ncbi:MAG: hypothetical protein JXR03_15805 [Cyclobacteriaceae bacterium]